MTIGLGVWAFVAYIAFVLIWNLAFKRRISEAMFIGMFVAAAFGGIQNMPKLVYDAVLKTARTDTRLAVMLFILMAILMSQTGIIHRLINILNSLLGRVRGGPAYISVLASMLMGLVSGSGTGVSATVGSVTIPWMKETGWSKEDAATINAGNAGLGISMPPSSTLFLMLGFAEVAAYLQIGDVYVALIVAGLWTVLVRALTVAIFIKKNHVSALPKDKIPSFAEAMKNGASSLAIFLGIIIPIIVTMGPLSEKLSASRFGADGLDAINLVIWVPVLLIVITLIEGWKYLPKDKEGRKKMFKKSMRMFATASAIGQWAVSGSNILQKVNFGKDLLALFETFALPTLLMVVAVGLVIILIAGPLSATATTSLMGPVGFLAMVGCGISPTLALCAYMCFVSTEGASPPSAQPIFISTGIAECEVESTFKPLILWYCIPTLILGILIAMGWLPLFVA